MKDARRSTLLTTALTATAVLGAGIAGSANAQSKKASSAEAAPAAAVVGVGKSTSGPVPVAGAQTLVHDVTGTLSIAALGDPANIVENINIGAGAHIIGLSWDVTLEGFTPSWRSEMSVEFTDSAITTGVGLRPGIVDESPGVGNYASDGILWLADEGLNFTLGQDGILRLEFRETFVDFPSPEPDGQWVSGTLTIEYVTTGAPCPGDLAPAGGDGTVDVSDLLALLSAWGPCADPGDCPADLSGGDGIVDVSDLLALLSAWGNCPPGGKEPFGACCFEDGPCQAQLTEAECATAGGTYNGDFTSCASCPLPPDGETCATALPIEPGETLPYDTTGNEMAAFDLCNGEVPNAPTAWFSVQGAGASLTVNVDTATASAAAVFCGSCDGLLCVDAGSNNSSGKNPFDAEVTWCAGEGNQYYIAVWRTDGGGDLQVSLSEGSACTPTVVCGSDNDTCATAIDITANIDGAPVEGDNTVAGVNDVPAGSPSCHWNGTPALINNAVWFKFTSPSSLITITSCDSTGSLVDTVIAIYSGSCGSLVEVGCGEDECGAPTYFSTAIASGLTVGETYYVMVANPGFGNPGTFTFEITSVAPTGACCTGTDCTSDVLQSDCNGVWFADQSCAEVTCPEGYLYDTGNSTNSINWTNGGVFLWAHRYDVDGGGNDVINSVSTTFNGGGGDSPGVALGQPFGMAILADTGAGPGAVLWQGTANANADAVNSDALQSIATGGVNVSGSFYVVAWAESAPSTFGSPLDENATVADGNAFFAGTIGGTFGTFDPANPVEDYVDINTAFPGVWILRAE